MSLGALIDLTQVITRTLVPIAIGTHGSAQVQARDLRLRPSDDGNVVKFITTTLPADIKRVHLGIMGRYAVGSVQCSY